MIAKSLAGPVGILAGTPGTGKTYTAAAVIRAIVESSGAHCVAVCAPTGKAAVRCTAAMQRYGLTLEAMTVHRLLQVTRNGYDGKGWGFAFNRACPLPFRVVVVDEVSMLDVDTAAALFDAFAPGTHVLLVGDPYQLPPVGHGAPLRDMIAAGLPYGELTEIQRNSGDGVLLCRDLKEGRRYWASNDNGGTIDVPAGRNVRHFETRSGAQSARALSLMLAGLPAELSPLWDVQVLVTLNEKSELSRKVLNEMLQEQLNPHGELMPGGKFRVGDKVICTSNTLLPLVVEPGEIPAAVEVTGEPEDEPKEFVANGEIGRIVSVEPKRMQVKFDCPARTVLVPMGKASGSTGDGGDDSQGCKFDLAYAITVHKSQGSQWPITITMVDSSSGANWIGSRELYYTALSRFVTLSVTIGQRTVIDKHTRKVALRERKTFLKEMLTGEREETAA